MVSGELYNALDKALVQERLNARFLIKELNNLGNKNEETKNDILTKLIPNKGGNLFIQPPFYCDYAHDNYVL